ncbi:MAG: DUF1028 domain-containing protein [Nodosilinea sp.]
MVGPHGGGHLAGDRSFVVVAVVKANSEGLDRRLLALEAGEAAGGDRRGRQSAALYVMDKTPYPHLDLRVDHHEAPIAMLRTLHTEAHKDYYQSFRQTMPSQLAMHHPAAPVQLPRVA